MADITQEIPALPELILASDVNPSDPASVDAFVAAYEANNLAITNSFTPAVNTWRTQANSLKADVNLLNQSTVTANANAQTAKLSAQASATTAESAKDTILGYVIPTEARYEDAIVDAKTKANFPFSGHCAVSKQEDNFVISNGILASKNRFVQFGDVTVDTYNHATYDAGLGGVKIDLVPAVPDTLVQDQTTYGNILQSAVNKDDFVVVDKANRNVNAWTGADSIQNGGFSFTSTGIGSAVSQNLGDTYAGYVWKLKFNITAISGSFRFDMEYDRSINNDRQGNVGTFSTTGVHEFIFTTTLTSVADLVLEVLSLGVAGDTITVADVVLEQVPEAYRAIQDAPVGTDVTNTAYFTDMSSHGVYNQVLVSHKSTSGVYAGLAYEVLQVEMSDSDNIRDVLLANGFAEVSRYQYSKGGSLYLPLVIWNTLNKGAYHPFVNEYGTRGVTSTDATNIAGRTWYGGSGILPSGIDINSLKNTFDIDLTDNYSLGHVGQGANGLISYTTSSTYYENTRPDPKYYDVIYQDQLIDCREYAKLITDDEQRLIKLDKIENGVVGGVFTEQVTQVAETTATLLVGDNANYTFGDVLQIWDGTTAYRRTVLDTSTNPITLDATIVKTAVPFNISGGKNRYLSSDTKLDIEKIGSPTNYQQIVKDRFASGLHQNFITNLIDVNTGLSNLPDGVKTTFLMSQKATQNLNVFKSTDSGVTWALQTLTTHYTIDLVANTITFVSAPASTDLILISNTAKNNPLKVGVKPVTKIEDKAIFTNSHSIYKGADLGNQVTGKIAVNGTTSGLESKVLENAEIKFDVFLDVLVKTKVNTGDTVLIVNNDVAEDGQLAVRVGASFDAIVGSASNILDDGVFWEFVGTTPTHSTVGTANLGTTAVPTAKYFEGFGGDDYSDCAVVFGEEITYDTISEWGDTDFSQLTNGTIPDVNGGNDVRTFAGYVHLNGKGTL